MVPGHSGYVLPFSPFKDPGKHDFHHSRFRVRYHAPVCTGLAYPFGCLASSTSPYAPGVAAVPQGNYGAIGLLDWLHGTDVEYKRLVERERLEAAKAAANLTQ